MDLTAMAMMPATTTIVEKIPAAVMMVKALSMVAAEPAVEPETQSDKEAPPPTTSPP